jgi:hypothetical protein
MSNTSPAEAANRTSKAIRYVAVLRGLGVHYSDPGIVALMSEKRWNQVAEVAGENVPSDATRAVIVTLLRELPKLPADAFAGLPAA